MMKISRKFVKQIIIKFPSVGSVYHACVRLLKPFKNSEDYWINRYKSGGHSGDGSYKHLAEFKAAVLNDFVSKNYIESIIEYGCGDGNQLCLARYPNYIGFDISPDAISRCLGRFQDDENKRFELMGAYRGESAELTLSLDVIYHLVEDSTFENYMVRLFNSSERFVVIYSSNTDESQNGLATHVRHREFSRWIEHNRPGWKLISYIPNEFPLNAANKNGSFADFYIYSK